MDSLGGPKDDLDHIIPSEGHKSMPRKIISYCGASCGNKWNADVKVYFNSMVQWLPLVLLILTGEVSDSNLGPNIEYPTEVLRDFLTQTGKC